MCFDALHILHQLTRSTHICGVDCDGEQCVLSALTWANINTSSEAALYLTSTVQPNGTDTNDKYIHILCISECHDMITTNTRSSNSNTTASTFDFLNQSAVVCNLLYVRDETLPPLLNCHWSTCACNSTDGLH